MEPGECGWEWQRCDRRGQDRGLPRAAGASRKYRPGRWPRRTHDQEAFAAALKEVEGRAEYVVKGRYVEQAVLAEALAEIPEAARLGKQIRGKDPNATRQARIRLGLIINNAIVSKRTADTRALGEVVAPHCAASVVREPTHELDAVHVALLVEITREDDLRQALSALASDWEGRIEIRLLGPQAPFDFTPTPLPPS
jgi:hypothetical protein